MGRGRARADSDKSPTPVQLPGDSNDNNKNSTSTYSFRPLRDGVFLSWSSLLQRQTDRPSANLSRELPRDSRATHPPHPLYVLHHSFWLGSLDPSESVLVPAQRSQTGSQGAEPCLQEGFVHQAKCSVCSLPVLVCPEGGCSTPTSHQS